MRVLPRAVSRGVKRPAREAFPSRLLKARRATKLSASALSAAAGLGRSSVSVMEAGKRLPRAGTVVQLAKVLGTSPAWLAFGDRGATGGPDLGGLGRRVKSAREALGITLHELGRRSESSYGLVQSVEGGSDPTIETVEHLATALRVKASWIAFGIGPRELPRRGARRGAEPTAEDLDPLPLVEVDPLPYVEPEPLPYVEPDLALPLDYDPPLPLPLDYDPPLPLPLDYDPPLPVATDPLLPLEAEPAEPPPAKPKRKKAPARPSRRGRE